MRVSSGLDIHDGSALKHRVARLTGHLCLAAASNPRIPLGTTEPKPSIIFILSEGVRKQVPRTEDCIYINELIYLRNHVSLPNP